MDCPTCEAMVDAYVDGELSATESVEFEQALAACPGCRARLESARDMSRLLRGMPAEPAPDLLRARIERELRSIAARPQERARERVRWMSMAASVIVALGVGWIGGSMLNPGTRQTDELVAGYLRVAMSDSGVEVASTDRHTVKPWFAGRIDYSPPVHDLTVQGFPLVGGRVDLVDSRKVAVLVYRHNQHRIALTLWPSKSTSVTAPTVSERDGFTMAAWRRGGFDLHAVADLSPSEMKSFAAAVDQAIATDR